MAITLEKHKVEITSPARLPRPFPLSLSLLLKYFFEKKRTWKGRGK